MITVMVDAAEIMSTVDSEFGVDSRTAAELVVAVNKVNEGDFNGKVNISGIMLPAIQAVELFNLEALIDNTDNLF